MFWIILSAIVLVIIIFQCCREPGDAIYHAAMFPGLIILIFFMYIITSFIVSRVAEIEYEKSADTNIESITSAVNVSGTCYAIKSQTYFYYVVKSGDGYKFNNVASDDVLVRYSDGEAHIEEYTPRFKSKFVTFFAGIAAPQSYIIYCPQGTITEKHEIELK